MKLSMSMIAERLEGYETVIDIKDDDATITGLRVFPDDQLSLSKEFVYLGRFGQLFSGEQDIDSYLVTHEQSSIKVVHCDYQELLNSLLAAFDYYNSWESKMLDAASRHAPLQRMLDLSVPLMRNPMFVSSMDGHILAVTRQGPSLVEDGPALAVRKGLQISVEYMTRPLFYEDGSPFSDLPQDPALILNHEGDYPFIGVYIRLDNEPVAGFITTQGNPAYTALDLQLIRRMMLILPMASEFQGARPRVRSKVSLLAGILDGEDIEEREIDDLVGRNFPAAPWRLVSFRHILRNDAPSRLVLCDALRQRSDICLPFEYKDAVLAMISDRKRDDVFSSAVIAPVIGNYGVGMSIPFSDIHSLPLRLRQVQFATGRAEGAGIFRCEDGVLDYLLGCVREHDAGLELEHPALEVLRNYDAAHGTSLYETLFEYLRCGGNLTEVSTALCIHRNSLNYRLGRIRELTGITLSDHEENIYLILSFMLDGALAAWSA